MSDRIGKLLEESGLTDMQTEALSGPEALRAELVQTKSAENMKKAASFLGQSAPLIQKALQTIQMYQKAVKSKKLKASLAYGVANTETFVKEAARIYFEMALKLDMFAGRLDRIGKSLF